MSPTRPVAIVTGAGRGIGAGIAIELAAQGFDIALADIEAAGTDAVLAQIEAKGGRARLFAFDLADVSGHAAVLERVAAWGGPLSCLVNNAGVGSPARGDLLDVATGAFDSVLGINLRGTFFFTQAVARHMTETRSAQARSIVTITSVSAEMASIDRAEYCLSKAALGMMTQLFALRLAPLGIGVFEIRPGVIRTPMTDAVAARYDQRIAEGLVPMGRWGLPADVARAVAMLSTAGLSFATGSVIHVDGALSIARL